MLRPGPLLIFLAAMMWATDGPFRARLLTEVSPLFLVFGEHAVDTLLVLPFLLARRRQLRLLTAREWGALLVIGIGGSAVATLAFTAAFAYVNPSVAVLLQKLQPLFAISLAVVLLREKPRRDFWIWALCALAGAYVISFPTLVPRLFEGEQFNPNVIGVSLALLAAVLWGASTVMGKVALSRAEPSTVAWLRFAIGFVTLGIWNMVSGDLAQVSRLSAVGWLCLLVVACTSGVVSLWIYYRGLRTTPASVATIAELGYVLAAVAVNAVTIASPLLWQQLLGMLVLLVAVFNLGLPRQIVVQEK